MKGVSSGLSTVVRRREQPPKSKHAWESLHLVEREMCDWISDNRFIVLRF